MAKQRGSRDVFPHERGDLSVIEPWLGQETGHNTQRLIHSLRAQGQSQSECLAAIAADQTLTEPVRQRALQFAREWK